MVAPKHKAIALTNRKEIIEALQETERIRPNIDKLTLLIKLFNEVHGGEFLTVKSYSSCGDCQRALKDFWKYVIKEWQKI